MKKFDIGKLNYKHGMARTRTHGRWASMMSRCYHEKNKKYHRYGGRGIKVCGRWHDFLNYLSDTGETPKGKTLDRIDNDGNYSPENCRWVDQKSQQNNRSNNRWLTFRGKTKVVTEWAVIMGISSKVIRQRIDRDGMSIEKALTAPIKNYRR